MRSGLPHGIACVCWLHGTGPEPCRIRVLDQYAARSAVLWAGMARTAVDSLHTVLYSDTAVAFQVVSRSLHMGLDGSSGSSRRVSLPYFPFLDPFSLIGLVPYMTGWMLPPSTLLASDEWSLGYHRILVSLLPNVPISFKLSKPTSNLMSFSCSVSFVGLSSGT